MYNILYILINIWIYFYKIIEDKFYVCILEIKFVIVCCKIVEGSKKNFKIIVGGCFNDFIYMYI